jgi:hypothetical protein
MTATHLELREMLKTNADRLPPWYWQRDDVFVRFNHEGKRSPIFWCFNNWIEPISLSKQLHAEQELVAMHSIHGIMNGKDTKAANLKTIKNLYAEGIIERAGKHPITVGGNCQGGQVAEAVAHEILARTNVAPLLVLLEHQPQYAYPGHVVMLFGSQSEKYNPFLSGVDPLPRWQALHRSFAFHILEGKHGSYFGDPAIGELAIIIQEATADDHLAPEVSR